LPDSTDSLETAVRFFVCEEHPEGDNHEWPEAGFYCMMVGLKGQHHGLEDTPELPKPLGRGRSSTHSKKAKK
jgi:hypothetical protein